MKKISVLHKEISQEKKRISEIAYDMFIEEGEIHMRELAKVAQIHTPTIYKLFDGKVGLMSSVFKLIAEKTMELLHANIQAHSNPFYKLTQYGVNYINLAISHKVLFFHAWNIQGNFIVEATEDYLGVLKSATEESIDLLKEIFYELYDMGITRNIDGEENKEENKEKNIEILTMHAWAQVHGLAMMCGNYAFLKKDLFTRFDDILLEMFMKLREAIIDPKFLESEEFDGESLDVLEIIATIKIFEDESVPII